MVKNCELSRRFRRCNAAGVAVCQYCGNSFCADHGERSANGQEICSQTTCTRKKEDLARHFAYREEVAERNQDSRCGQESCDSGPQVECAKCKGRFCLRHVQERTFNLRDGAPARGLICSHCHGRRKIWSS
jgi:hypothetical protein